MYGRFSNLPGFSQCRNTGQIGKSAYTQMKSELIACRLFERGNYNTYPAMTCHYVNAPEKNWCEEVKLPDFLAPVVGLDLILTANQI